MSIKILIADDHKMMRDGLKSMLENEQDLQVIAESEKGIETIQKTKEFKPDIAILDVAMPELNGIETARLLSVEVPNTKIIGLSMHSDRQFVIEMLRAGASGFVLKQAAFEELTNAIRTVAQGKTFLSSAILDIVVQDYVRQFAKSESPAYRQLTDRERQILQLLAEGNSTKEIAYMLSLSVKTIETHRLNIRNKLGIGSFAGLVKFAIREGITTLET